MTVENSAVYRQKRRLVSDSGEEGSFLLHAGSLAPHDPGGGDGHKKGKSQPCSPRLRHVSPRARSRSESVPAMGVTSKMAVSSPEPIRRRNGHRSRREGSETFNGVTSTNGDVMMGTHAHTSSPSCTKEDLALEAVMM